MSIILSILLTLLILSILVLVHEIGHFVAARSIGCPVESFSIGMGPVLKRWKWRRFGETEFRLSAVPFGGYVIVNGEGEVSEDPNNFFAKTPWQRIWFAGAGVLMNIILAVVIFVCGSLFFGDVGVPFNQVGMLQPGAARNAGLQQGEWILSVNGTPTPDWISVPTEIRKLPNKEITLLMGKDAGKATVSLSEGSSVAVYGAQAVPLSKVDWPEEKEIQNNTFLVIGTKFYQLNSIAKVGEKEVSGWDETVYALKGIVAPTEVAFGNSLETHEVKLTTGIGHDEEGKEIGVIGVVPAGSTVRLPFLEAIWFGLQKFWFTILGVLLAIGNLFRGNLENIGGVIAIGDMIGQSANLGLNWVFNLAGQLSVALAIFNIIPFPGLDGSRIFFSLIEGITGKKLPRAVENVIHGIGFIILMVLLVALIGRDLFLRIFK
jgi:regulator of sigma E protease